MQKAIRITALVVVLGFLAALVVANILNPPRPDMSVWNEAMTIGDAETAKHHFIMYTDIFCPFCDKFSNAIAANEEDFKKHYIEDKNILFELRVTDVNYVNGHSNNSRPAGISAYCAARQGKFWDYYHALLKQMYDNYFAKGIGVDPYSEHIPDLSNQFFFDAAEATDLNKDSFKTCVENSETADELDKNTTRAQSLINGGVPRFVFDKYVADGFLGNWNTTNDYKQARTMLDAGLTK